MRKCFTPCVYYHETYDKQSKPSVKVVCDIREGEEIKNISDEDINNCKNFKTYKDVKFDLLVTH